VATADAAAAAAAAAADVLMVAYFGRSIDIDIDRYRSIYCSI